MYDASPLEKILVLKERADEDRYFAERDRELIAVLRHARESKHEDMIRERAHFRCPQCGVRLQQIPFHGVVMDVCRVGHGAWLRHEQLETVTQSAGQQRVKDFLTLMADLMKPPLAEGKQDRAKPFIPCTFG